MWGKILIKKVLHFDYTIKYKKRYSTTQPRKIELAFLTRKFISKQIAEENKKLNECWTSKHSISHKTRQCFSCGCLTTKNGEQRNSEQQQPRDF